MMDGPIFIPEIGEYHVMVKKIPLRTLDSRSWISGSNNVHVQKN